MSARLCSECARPVGLWRRLTCSPACHARRDRRVTRERMWRHRHPHGPPTREAARYLEVDEAVNRRESA